MQKQQRKALRRIRRILIVVLPVLILSLAALLTANRYIRQNQETPPEEFAANTDSSAKPDIAAAPDVSTDPDHSAVPSVPTPAGTDAGNEAADADSQVPDTALTQEPQTGPEIEEEPVTLLFTGDVLLSGYVLDNYKNNGIEGVLSPELLAEMQDADITVINNEFPFSTRGSQAPDKQFTFRVDPQYVRILTDMGVDIAGLANNHVLDYGAEALLDTFDTLEHADIDYMGAGNDVSRAEALITKKSGGRTFGFLAASRVIPVVSWDIRNSSPGVFTTYDPARLIAAIENAKDSCDYLTVFVHWGIERDEYPQDYQVAMAKQYIDAGADLVIGSHPHVLQGITYYKEKPICYSLGNFIFNQSIPQTAAVKVTIDGEKEPVVRLIAATAKNARTSSCEGSEKDAIYDHLESISTGISINDDGILSHAASSSD